MVWRKTDLRDRQTFRLDWIIDIEVYLSLIHIYKKRIKM